jgi:hypothetical protein
VRVEAGHGAPRRAVGGADERDLPGGLIQLRQGLNQGPLGGRVVGGRLVEDGDVVVVVVEDQPQVPCRDVAQVGAEALGHRGASMLDDEDVEAAREETEREVISVTELLYGSSFVVPLEQALQFAGLVPPILAVVVGEMALRLVARLAVGRRKFRNHDANLAGEEGADRRIIQTLEVAMTRTRQPLSHVRADALDTAVRVALIVLSASQEHLFEEVADVLLNDELRHDDEALLEVLGVTSARPRIGRAQRLQGLGQPAGESAVADDEVVHLAGLARRSPETAVADDHSLQLLRPEGQEGPVDQIVREARNAFLSDRLGVGQAQPLMALPDPADA